MSVYIDPEFLTPRSAVWKWRSACHLFADTEGELDAFAPTIGLKPGWLQHRPGKLRHYDLSPTKRALAVRAGAVYLDRVAAVEKIRELLIQENRA